jgi:hypothetical protein
LRTHADGGPAFAPLELVYVFPALVKSLHAAWELSAPQLVYLSFQAAALLNICPKTVTPSAKFHMVMSSSKTLLFWNILSGSVTLLTSQVDKPRGCASLPRFPLSPIA